MNTCSNVVTSLNECVSHSSSTVVGDPATGGLGEEWARP